MVKRLFYLAVGAMAFTACTSEDVVDDAVVSRNQIKFENVVSKLSRADIDNSMSKFNVSGYYTLKGGAVFNQVFDNTPVEKDGTDWKVASSAERYWVPGANYYFYAYSYGDGTTSLDATLNASHELEIADFVCDNANDLVFAANIAGIEGKETGNAPVALQFKHILSKIKTNFISTFPSEYQVVVSNVKVSDVANKGSFNSADADYWKNVAAAESSSFALLDGENTLSIQNAEGAKQADATGYAYVMPNKYTENISVEFTIELYYNEGDVSEKVMTRTLKGSFAPDWKQGYTYIYNIELNGSTTNMEVISFTVEKVDAFGNPVDDAEDPNITKFETVTE
ncbi:MAG: fimbrillin family protein [Muribaculaceae bacterium]|nr:fimbrillin family protein [Muribaculaceae bacterium]